MFTGGIAACTGGAACVIHGSGGGCCDDAVVTAGTVADAVLDGSFHNGDDNALGGGTGLLTAATEVLGAAGLLCATSFAGVGATDGGGDASGFMSAVFCDGLICTSSFVFSSATCVLAGAVGASATFAGAGGVSCATLAGGVAMAAGGGICAAIAGNDGAGRGCGGGAFATGVAGGAAAGVVLLATFAGVVASDPGKAISGNPLFRSLGGMTGGGKAATGFLTSFGGSGGISDSVISGPLAGGGSAPAAGESCPSLCGLFSGTGGTIELVATVDPGGVR